MKKCVLIAGASLLASLTSSAGAEQAARPAHTMVSPDQIKWTAGPPSLPAGARAAVLYGDPSKEGLFVLRLQLPKGYRIPPHTHPRPEIVTVISGAFHIGMGPTANPKAATRLPPGGFFAFDPGMAHFAHVQEETVVQLSSTGPWTINYINAADDPRGRK